MTDLENIAYGLIIANLFLIDMSFLLNIFGVIN